MLELSLRYGLFVFIGVVGLLQAAGSYNNLQGLLFFKAKISAYIFALLSTGGALCAFFTWNYWGETGVIEGSQQFGLFLLSGLLALVFTLVVSSTIKLRTFSRPVSLKDGLDSLKIATYLESVRRKKRGKVNV
jgi:hypothetical protein